MKTAVESIIYFYLIICAALLLFNLAYILRSVVVDRRKEERIKRWRRFLSDFQTDGTLTESVIRRLKRTDELIAFFAVITEKIGGDSKKSPRLCE